MATAAASIKDKKPYVQFETVGDGVTSCVYIRGPVGCQRAEFDALVTKERARFPTAEPSTTRTFVDGTMCHMFKVRAAPNLSLHHSSVAMNLQGGSAVCEEQDGYKMRRDYIAGCDCPLQRAVDAGDEAARCSIWTEENQQHIEKVTLSRSNTARQSPPLAACSAYLAECVTSPAANSENEESRKCALDKDSKWRHDIAQHLLFTYNSEPSPRFSS